MYKIRLQRDFFETCNKWMPFCWHKNLVSWGLSAPAPGLYTCIKSWENCIKSDFKDIFLKLATTEWSDKTFLLTSKLCPLGGCLPLPRGYLHVLNHEKICIKSDFKEILLKLLTNDPSDKMFLLTSKFCPRGVVSPCPRAIYMYKIMKKMVSNQTSKFETCSKWLKWQDVSVDIKILSPGVVCPWPAAIYIY